MKQYTKSLLSFTIPAAFAFIFIITMLLTGCPPDASGQPPLDGNTNIIFLHHSTGDVIWGGGVSSWFDNYNTAQSTNYQITKLAYPNSPYPWANYPYDYWHLWVDNGGMAETEGQPTLEYITQNYDVIVFKHCFPVSSIVDNTGNPDISSQTKSLENYQLQYNALKAKLRQFPTHRFIVWTGAALIQGATNPDDAGRAYTFFNWVKNTWDENGDNIYVWDFWELETEGGLYLKPEYATGDSHPNSTFAAAVAPYFSQRVVDVIEGRGDTGSITGQ